MPVSNARPATSVLTATGLLLTVSGVLLERALQWHAGLYIAASALVAVLILCMPRFGIREIYLLCLSVALTVWVAWTEASLAEAVLSGLDQAAFLMAFIVLLAMLYESASTSPSVERVGRWLATQPAGRRFTALFWGTNVMGVLFNLGVVSMLTPLVDKQDRRQSAAILMGIAWTVVWAPTALAPLAVMELIDGIDRQRWTWLGFLLTTLVFMVGWIENRLRGPASVAAAARSHSKVPWRSVLGFAAALLSLGLLVSFFNGVVDNGFVFSLMLSCPLMMAAWLAVQSRGDWHAWREAGAHIVFKRLPDTATVAVTLAFSGYIGRVAAVLVPDDMLSRVLPLDAMPDYLLLFAIPLVMIPLSWLALSPIMLAVFLGSVFGAMPQLPADPTLIALAISVGWALSMTASPFATVVLMMARMLEQKVTALSIGWNWRYNLALLPVFLAFFVVITGGR